MKLITLLATVATLTLLSAPAAAQKVPLPSKTASKALVKSLSPKKVMIRELRSTTPGTRLYLAEFDPSRFSSGAAAPHTGLLALISKDYAIVSFYGAGEHLFSRGGPVNNLASWTWVDPAGNPIPIYDERVSRFDALAAPFYLSGKPLPARARQLLDNMTPKGAKTVELPSKDNRNRLFLIEFDPSAYKLGRGTPEFGAMVLLNSRYGIISYYSDGQHRYATGGPLIDKGRARWSLTDKDGTPISVNNPNLLAFTKRLTDFVSDAGKKNYIVLFRKRDVTDMYYARQALAEELRGNEVKAALPSLDGYVVEMSPEEVATYQNRSDVLLVEEDSAVATTTRNSKHVSRKTDLWGLDRVDQRRNNFDGRIVTANQGKGVNIYVIDSGVNSSHQELSSRVSPGLNTLDQNIGRSAFLIDKGLPGSIGETNDCSSHGSHVAGTAAGKTTGVAPAATIIPVRVFDCLGQGKAAQTLSAIDWMIAHHQPGQPAVVNMSLGFERPSPAVDAAVRRAVADRITVVASAGNDSRDACNQSPARTFEAITVGASTVRDNPASFSNWGPCVDLFAPGDDIRSSLDRGDTYGKKSGTSMAAPHVAGAAALYLSRFRNASPAQVQSYLVSRATTNVLVWPGDYSGNGLNTTNRLLYVGP